LLETGRVSYTIVPIGVVPEMRTEIAPPPILSASEEILTPIGAPNNCIYAVGFPHYPGLEPDDRCYPQAPFGWD
jgi:hypothetical protein